MDTRETVGPRRRALKLVRAWPRLRVTDAYARLMAQRGGSRRAYPKAVGIKTGGELHLCVVVEGKLRGNQRDA
jgi:hypothetical protein